MSNARQLDDIEICRLCFYRGLIAYDKIALIQLHPDKSEDAIFDKISEILKS